jgi:hypothetical protein
MKVKSFVENTDDYSFLIAHAAHIFITLGTNFAQLYQAHRKLRASLSH